MLLAQEKSTGLLRGCETVAGDEDELELRKGNMNIRSIDRVEIEEIRKIDRSEIVTHIYYLIKGELILKEEYYDIRSWHPDEINKIIKRSYELFDRGGTFYAALDNSTMIGFVALENEFIGKNRDQLQLVFLYVSKNFRRKGIGTELLDLAKRKAKELGAEKLYISATPSKSTVDFYVNRGCKLADEINKQLFELEPEDIHLDLKL